jgi:FMN phosphatase YigB (HAD superfamily)
LVMWWTGNSLERDILPTQALGIASVYVGEDELPEDSTATRLDLTTLAELLDRVAQDREGAAGSAPRP